MELRDIEVFLALAEELHFGRTAERLHITASRVSHVIKKQERRIGTALFERTSRTVRLTPVGERLYQTLRPAYRQIIDGVEEVSAAAGAVQGTLALGSMGPQGWMSTTSSNGSGPATRLSSSSTATSTRSTRSRHCARARSTTCEPLLGGRR